MNVHFDAVGWALGTVADICVSSLIVNERGNQLVNTC